MLTYIKLYNDTIIESLHATKNFKNVIHRIREQEEEAKAADNPEEANAAQDISDSWFTS